MSDGLLVTWIRSSPRDIDGGFLLHEMCVRFTKSFPVAWVYHFIRHRRSLTQSELCIHDTCDLSRNICAGCLEILIIGSINNTNSIFSSLTACSITDRIYAFLDSDSPRHAAWLHRGIWDRTQKALIAGGAAVLPEAFPIALFRNETAAIGSGDGEPLQSAAETERARFE